MIAKIPGLKQVAGKFLGGGIDKLKESLKKLVIGGLNKAIDKLRRRQRRARRQGLFKKLGKFVKKAAKTVKKAAKSVAKTVSKVAKDAGKIAKSAAAGVGKLAAVAQQMAAKLDGLTGGKLSGALIKIVCPGLAKVMEVAMNATLKAFGWPGNVPSCLIDAVLKGCVACVKLAFKKYRMLRNLRRMQNMIKMLPAAAF